jgi:hypothetical protein
MGIDQAINFASGFVSGKYDGNLFSRKQSMDEPEICVGE